jgi:hypothetical protein
LQLHLTYLQFLAAAIALAIAAFLALLALAAFIHDRRRKPPPFLDYHSSDFDRDYSRQDLLAGADEWREHNRIPAQAYGTHKANRHNGDWE